MRATDEELKFLEGRIMAIREQLQRHRARIMDFHANASKVEGELIAFLRAYELQLEALRYEACGDDCPDKTSSTTNSEGDIDND